MVFNGDTRRGDEVNKEEKGARTFHIDMEDPKSLVLQPAIPCTPQTFEIPVAMERGPTSGPQYLPYHFPEKSRVSILEAIPNQAQPGFKRSSTVYVAT